MFKKILLLLMLTLHSLSAQAVLPSDEAPRGDAYYFAVKGGISLGSYETGMNRTLLRHVEEGGGELVSFSGASAGSINSVLSAIDACIEDKRVTIDDIVMDDSAQQNFMRWTWDLGINELVPERDGGKDQEQHSIFSRDGFNAKKKLIKQLLQRDAVPGCDIIITMSITKIEPYSYDIQEIGETVKLQRFVIPVRVFERSGKIHFENYLPLHKSPEAGSIAFPTPYLRLIENDAGLIEFDDIWDLGQASSAFPLAFPPVPLRYCYPLELETGELCTTGRARTEFFSDGGFFDNSPIGVSLDVYDLRKEHDWRSMRLIYINPDSYRSHQATTQRKQDDLAVTGLYDYASYFIDSFSNALDNEYRSALKRLSRIETERRRFYMSNRFHHLLADVHEHFGAFYAEEFRMHDYLVGIYDGHHLIAQIECDEVLSNGDTDGVNRFNQDYRKCVREQMLEWVGSEELKCPADANSMAQQDLSSEFFKYLFNTEYEKSLTQCHSRQNLYIALSKAFESVSMTRGTEVDYGQYLDRLEVLTEDMYISKHSDLGRILQEGRKFSAEKLSAIYENVISMQQAAARCPSCPGRQGNQYIGTALKVAEPIVDSFIAHHDSQIWPYPFADVFSVGLGFNLNQKNQVLSADFRPKFLTFGKYGIDFSLAYHDFGNELADDDFFSAGLGLTRHNQENAFLMTTWTLGYQYETKGDNMYDSDLESLYLKGGFLNELISLKLLHRLEEVEKNTVQTRANNAFVLTIDVAKVCKMALPDWCGR